MPAVLDLPAPRARRDAAASDIPPLENGDRLSVAEFLRRYEAMPELKKAELIQGEAYVMASPVRIDQHGIPDHDHIMQMWLGVYAASVKGGRGATNSTVRLGPGNVPQPDGLLFRDTDHGGKASIGADGYLHGPPDLAVEIAASSASLDAGKKRRTYLTCGVREYVLVRVRDGSVDWWSLEDDDYVRIEPDDNGILSSRVFPGLWLDPVALLDGDAGRVLEAVQRGIARAGAMPQAGKDLASDG